MTTSAQFSCVMFVGNYVSSAAHSLMSRRSVFGQSPFTSAFVEANRTIESKVGTSSYVRFVCLHAAKLSRSPSDRCCWGWRVPAVLLRGFEKTAAAVRFYENPFCKHWFWANGDYFYVNLNLKKLVGGITRYFCANFDHYLFLKLFLQIGTYYKCKK